MPRIVENRLTTGWKLAGTETFRLASSKLLGFYGTNLQNPSPSLMACIIPEDGYVFLQGDQSGAEALIVAMEAPYGKFRQLFENNIKPHSYMALQIFTDKFRGEAPASRYKFIEPKLLATYPELKALLKTIKNADREYALGKMVIHAKNYDMKFRTFMINTLERSEGQIVLTAAQSKSFLDTHEATFPEIIELQSMIRGRLAATRTLRNLFGFPRRFEQLWSDNLLRKAYAFIPQSTVGTITNIAFTEIHHYIKKHNLPWIILNNKHDSILLEVPDADEHKQHGAEILRKGLERDLTSTTGVEYKMKSEIAIGHNWAKYHEKTNQHGMKEVA